MAADPQLLDEIVELIGSTAGDWEHDTPITRQTYFLADLGYESLDLVVLGSVLEERYGRMPFAAFLASIGERELQDLSVGELADFVAEHASRPAAKESR